MEPPTIGLLHWLTGGCLLHWLTGGFLNSHARVCLKLNHGGFMQDYL